MPGEMPLRRSLANEAFATTAAYDAAIAAEPYLTEQLAKGARLSQMTRHMLTLFHGAPGARLFRRILAEEAVKPGAGLDVWRKALGVLRPKVEMAA